MYNAESIDTKHDHFSVKTIYLYVNALTCDVISITYMYLRDERLYISTVLQLVRIVIRHQT